MTSNTETLRDRLIRHEGMRFAAYRDTMGKLTIGVGRCLDTKGISRDEALYLLDNDIAYITEHAAIAFPWMTGLNPARRDVLLEMCFQLGINGVLGFKNALAAMRDHSWASASTNMLNSAWHKQTPARCEELANIMLKGA